MNVYKIHADGKGHITGNTTAHDLYGAVLDRMQEAMKTPIYTARLRTCSAHVVAVPGGIVLVSYNTPIAFYDYETKQVHDFLRTVYGYTATSAQHFSKFYHDYGNGKDVIRWIW